MHCLYFIRERKFYPGMQAKITRHWKSALKERVDCTTTDGELKWITHPKVATKQIETHSSLFIWQI